MRIQTFSRNNLKYTYRKNITIRYYLTILYCSNTYIKVPAIIIDTNTAIPLGTYTTSPRYINK